MVRKKLTKLQTSLTDVLQFYSRHVFADIRAYVCTSSECGMLMFGSFDAWRSHEMDHRREWFCPMCNLLHHDKSKARMHVMRHHSELVEHHEIDLLLQTSSRLSENLPADDCPFCDWGMTLRKRNRTPTEHDLTVPSRRFMKHLGRHLEEIAIFVIPEPEEGQRSSGDTDSNAVHAALDEHSATASTLPSFDTQPEEEQRNSGDSPTGLMLSSFMTPLEEERINLRDTASNTTTLFPDDTGPYVSVAVADHDLVGIQDNACEICGKLCRDKTSLRYVAKLYLSSGSMTDVITHSDAISLHTTHRKQPGTSVINVGKASDTRKT